jgi:hypothetical protein
MGAFSCFLDLFLPLAPPVPRLATPSPWGKCGRQLPDHFPWSTTVRLYQPGVIIIPSHIPGFPLFASFSASRRQRTWKRDGLCLRRRTSMESIIYITGQNTLADRCHNTCRQNTYASFLITAAFTGIHCLRVAWPSELYSCHGVPSSCRVMTVVENGLLFP